MNRKEQIIEDAMAFHRAWMALVNFHHPGSFSSRASEALAAGKAHREVRDKYDEAFARLTAACELYRQELMR
jgi:hypothetical protein